MGWNERQEEAISKRNSNILVSASAGSGKTAVLSERIVRICLDEKVDIDKFVVVTFTRLAASEMKSRISKLLVKAKDDEKYDSDYIDEELILLEKANISTLDSFNIALLRDYFYLIDLEPNFKIMDEIDNEILSSEVMDKLFDKYYKLKDDVFIKLISMYSDPQTDDGLKSLINKIYYHISNMPNEEKALNEILSSMKDLNIENGMVYKYFINDTLKVLNEYKNALKDYTSLHDVLNNEYTLITELIEKVNSSYDDAYNYIQGISFDTLRFTKSNPISDTDKEEVTSLRNTYKKFINDKLKKKFYKDNLETFSKESSYMNVYLEKLISLVKEYKDNLFEEKKKNNTYDFNDIAHLAIKLLVDENGNYTSVAKNLKKNFEYIIIDEYQDINEIQETILNAIARQDKDSNMFMVGDVKQSIYRFRKADPEIFTNKYNAYKENKVPSSIKIDLNKNYRSRKEVLDSINFIFEKVMTKDIGGIEYDDEMALKYGELYKDKENYDYKTELLLLPKVTKETSEEKVSIQSDDTDDSDNELNEMLDPSNAIYQAKVIVNKIKELMENNTQKYDVKDKEDFVPLKYSDIAILFRGLGMPAQILFDELKRNGIPAVITKQDNFLDEIDVKIAISMLKVIDNPYDDISFVTTMYSDYYRFTPEELMTLKQRNTFITSFYQICQSEYEKLNDKDNSLNSITKEKVKAVIETYNFLKEFSLNNTLYDLIKKIYEIFNQEKYFLKYMNMKNKIDNMNMLLKFASKFEETGSKNIYDFIVMLNKIEKNKKELDMKQPIESSNAVTIMTIHKSKGLEYSVVFMSQLEKNFNKKDIMVKTLIDKQLGFASKYINLEKSYQKTNLLFETIKKKIMTDSIAEEMRIFYVAMTRAKEKLYLVASYSEPKTGGNRFKRIIHNGVIDYSRLTQSTSFLDFVMPCLEELDAPKYIDVKNIDTNFELTDDSKKESLMKELFDEVKDIKSDMKDDDYKYKESINIKKKVSVTELKKKYLEEIEDSLIIDNDNEEEKESIKAGDKKEIKHYESEVVRKLMRDDPNKLSGAEKGTIMHKLAKIIFNEDIDKEFERLISENIFTENELSQIDKSKLAMYINSTTYKRIDNSNFVKREMPFMLKKKACEIYPNVSEDDYVIIQGIIDCLFEEDDKIVILDYKTDKVIKDGISKEDRIEEIKKSYKKQLDLYEEAVKLIYGKEIKEKILYLFDSGDEVKID